MRRQPTQTSRSERVPLRASASFLFGSEDGKRVAPTEFRVFPAGSFVTVKGTFVFSGRSAESVMTWYNKRQLPLMGDYEHMTDEPAVGRPPTIAPASIMEMTPVIRANDVGGPELWVTNVKWTAAARHMLEEGEYRFFSPTFLHDPETKEVLALLRIALTNDPAIDDLEPLVAASSAVGDGNATPDDGETTMADETPKCARCAATDAHLSTMQEQLKTLKAQHEDLAGQHKTLGASHQELVGKHQELLSAHETMMKSFEQWAAEESEEHEETPATASGVASLCARRVGQLRSLRRELVKLTGEKTSGAMLGKATAWQRGAGELVTLKADAEKAVQEKLSADFKSLTDKLVKEAKLTPAQRDRFVEQSKTQGVGHVIAFLTTAYGPETPPIVNREETRPPDPETSAALTTLSGGVQAEMARFFGSSVTVEQAAKAKAAWDQHLRANTAGATR